MLDQITIRPLREVDIPAAAAIVGKNYSEKYEQTSADEMREMFGNGPIRPSYVVAEQNAVIVGLAGYIQSWMDYHGYNLFWVNVDPACQRIGIGKQLVARVIGDIRNLEGAYFILLTSTSPSYYANHFGFSTLATFGPKKSSLMHLSLE